MHRVAPVGRAPFGLLRAVTTAPATLEAYLERRREWPGVGPRDLLGGAERGGLLVTFDDGYRSVATAALPLLERYRVPCVVFVTTSFAAGEAEPYEMELSRWLAGATEVRTPGGETIVLHSADDREAAYRRIRLEIKPWPVRRRRSYLRRESPPGGDAPSAEFLGPQELRELDRHPLVTLGAHTEGHPLLTGVSPLAVWRELRRSKSRLESWLGHRVELFAYPYGGVSGSVRALVRLAGYRAAFTTRPGRVPREGPEDRFAIPRNAVDENGSDV